VLAQGKTPINGPHQGAWVDTPAGESWFIHSYRKANVGKTYPVMTPADTDEFNGSQHGLQWQWAANPKPGWVFPAGGLGLIRLFCIPLPEGFKNFWDVPNLLLQKFPAPQFTATAKVAFTARTGDEKTRLIVMGTDYAYLAPLWLALAAATGAQTPATTFKIRFRLGKARARLYQGSSRHRRRWHHSRRAGETHARQRRLTFTRREGYVSACCVRYEQSRQASGEGLSGRNSIASIVGNIPHRMALAGGWIDQPFVSRHNPSPPGSMVVVSLEPNLWLMDRCGMASGTRKVASELWGGGVPDRPPVELVRELYRAENKDKAEPSGSQDMIGLLYPGVSRLDYDAGFEGGYFPEHIESNCDRHTARWLEEVIHLVPIGQRPEGYNPLGVKNLDPQWIRQLGQTCKDCFDAIVANDIGGLAASMNHSMRCWEAILPQTMKHPTLQIDLKRILSYYQQRYAGAMYSGCGGGYAIVASEEPVPGALKVKVKTC